MSQPTPQIRLLLDDLARQGRLPEGAVKHLEDAVSSSPLLSEFMSNAVESKSLRHIRLSPPETNSAGHFDAKGKIIYINENVFERFKDSDASLHDYLVATLGHETSHAAGQVDYQQAYERLNKEVVATYRKTPRGQEANLTEAVKDFLDATRDQEAAAERAGWNMLADRVVRGNEGVLDSKNLIERAEATTSCVVGPHGGPYALAPGLSLDNHGLIARSQREALAQCHVDSSGHSLGRDGNANYRNYYGAAAISTIAAMSRHYGHDQEIRLDLTRLGLDKAQLEGSGLNLGREGRSILINDPAAGVVRLEHTFNQSARVAPDTHVASALSQELERAPLAANAFSNPAHPDHALYRNVQQAVQDQLPEGAKVSEDRLAQLTLAAKEARFQPNEHIDASIGETTLSLRGEHPAHLTRVDLAAPLPAMQETLQRAETSDHEQIRQAEQYTQQQASQQQTAPVMEH